MSDPEGDNIALCRKWYSAFDSGDLDALMALFTENAVVVVGAGGSSSAVDYSGTYVGKDAIKAYYKSRIESRNNPRGLIRPFCGFLGSGVEYGPWVMFWGQIVDRQNDGPESYRGAYLHVWTIDVGQRLISSLEMFLDPSGKVLFAKAGAGATAVPSSVV